MSRFAEKLGALSLDEKIELVREACRLIADEDLGVECVGPRKHAAILELGDRLQEFCESEQGGPLSPGQELFVETTIQNWRKP
jgi:hypothetical protein